MEGKMIVRGSRNEEFQIVDKVLLDDFSPKKIRVIEVGLKDDDLQGSKNYKEKV